MRINSTLAATIVALVASCQATVEVMDSATAEAPPAPGLGSSSAEMLATYSHDVYFVLEDVGQIDGLIAACWRLREIPGVLHIAAGRRDSDQAREINDTGFHVALHVEFDSAESYAGYGPHPIHQALVTAYGAGFERVVVYDSLIQR